MRSLSVIFASLLLHCVLDGVAAFTGLRQTSSRRSDIKQHGVEEGLSETIPQSVTVQIKHSSRNALSFEKCKAYGSADDVKNADWVVLQSFSGVVKGGDEDGSEVVGIAELGSDGEIILHKDLITAKPPSMKWDQASLLPYLAVTVVGNMMAVGITPESVAGKNVVVIGGSNAQSCFAAQLVKGWGCGKLTIASTEREQAMKDHGADQVIDYRKESFCEDGNSVDFIIDSLGDETRTMSASLANDFGIKYASIASPVLSEAGDKGMLAIMRYNGAMKQSRPAGCAGFRAAPAPTAPLLAAAASAVLGRAPLPRELVSLGDFTAALTWPTDSESGFRFGFPSKYSQFDADVSEEEAAAAEARGFPAVASAAERQAAQEAAQALREGVVEVTSLTHLGNILRDRGAGVSVLYFSAPWCRACGALTPRFARESKRMPEVSFLNLCVGEHKDVALTLGVEAVPAVMVFKDKAKVSEHTVGPEKGFKPVLDTLPL
mmetsp:Transcript_25229/g.39113  ORF Transcript_25229/g.39113 Transcript_25229/m.39113 type:complete len:490 (+) Transcript_25229:177-1646(+)